MNLIHRHDQNDERLTVAQMHTDWLRVLRERGWLYRKIRHHVFPVEGRPPKWDLTAVSYHPAYPAINVITVDMGHADWASRRQWERLRDSLLQQGEFWSAAGKASQASQAYDLNRFERQRAFWQSTPKVGDRLLWLTRPYGPISRTSIVADVTRSRVYFCHEDTPVDPPETREALLTDLLSLIRGGFIRVEHVESAEREPA